MKPGDIILSLMTTVSGHNANATPSTSFHTTHVQLMTSVPGGGAIFEVTSFIVEPEIRISVLRASTLSSAPWIRAVPFFKSRYLFWLIVVSSKKDVTCSTAIDG